MTLSTDRLPSAPGKPAGPTVLIAGPTAAGKSTLALAAAERFGGVLINADSMQVYHDLRILTARPGPAVSARVPHRLYGWLPAVTPCSAAKWAAAALDEIEAAWQAGQLPIVVGGTGLYFRALTEGLSAIPPVSEAARREARGMIERLGTQVVHQKLGQIDAAAAARIVPSDVQRLTRAMEVFVGTGRSVSAWQQARARTAHLHGPVLTLVLQPARAALYRRCDQRFDAMVAAGALGEVEALLDRDLAPDLPVMRAIGVRELGRHLRGTWSLDQAVDAAKTATRRYAKRQYTWFNGQIRDAVKIAAQDKASMAAECCLHVQEFLSAAKC